MKRSTGFWVGIGCGGEDGVVACGMQTEHDLGFRRFFDSQALRADGHASIAADLDDGSDAPHIIPPRATRGWTQDGAFFFAGLIPGPLRGLAQFAMDFLFVTVCPQVIDMGIGDCDFGDPFAGEVVSGRKLLFLEAAQDVEVFWTGGESWFSRRQAQTHLNAPAKTTPLLSDLPDVFQRGDFQAAIRTVSERARSRASNSRPMTCRL